MIPVHRLTDIPAEDFARLMRRAHADIAAVSPVVQEIIDAVQTRGDAALVEYTRQWDDPQFAPSQLTVTDAEIDEAYTHTAPSKIDAIKEQIRRSQQFHEAQRTHAHTWETELESGIIAGEKWTPVPRAGLYVPGGKNPFPTVQQILAVAAVAAGCPEVVSCISPKGKNYEVLIAARECGVHELYRVGGAQAIAALAYGTETIKPVKVIAGPGNPYVTAAKIAVQDRVVIDMPAGPSEAVLLADASVPSELSIGTKAAFLAADILARAEHGPDSAAVLVTDSETLAFKVRDEVQAQFALRSRKEYIDTALKTYCAVLICSSMNEAIQFTNDYAPEHLEVLTEQPEAVLAQIVHAGSVFLGHFNPVAVGDYASGVNHVLPTGGWAACTSAVGVWTFMKRVQYSHVSKGGLKQLQPIVDTIATVEGLDGHRYSVDIRFEKSPTHDPE